MARVEELAHRVKQIPALVAILSAPLIGGATAGFAHKGAQLRAELAELSQTDSHPSRRAPQRERRRP